MSDGKQLEPLGVYDDDQCVCRPITTWERDANSRWLCAGPANDTAPAPFTPGPIGFDDRAERSSVGLDRISPASGFLFVVMEQLPEIGDTSRIVRKVAVLPRDFALAPARLSGTLSIADHAMGVSPQLSQFLSASDRPFGAPSINGRPVLIDTAGVRAAGGYVHSVQDVLADLRRFADATPSARPRIEKLMWAVERVEGEVLITGVVPGSAVSQPGPAHLGHIRSAEGSYRAFEARQLSRAQLEAELASLHTAYARARIVGRVGRVLTVVGVVVTVADLAVATNRSIEQRSFRPITAEAIRQVGGWGGALVGAKIGFAGGALFGIETGPGALITGGVGALIFGGLGYFGFDLMADQISPN